MNRNLILKLVAVVVLSSVAVSGPRVFADTPPRELPNIVMLLADDLGYGDLGCYSDASKVPTPNIDKLAASGTRLTTAYCPAGLCSPTRYAFMTGAYPWRSWKQSGVIANWEKPMIADDQLTLPGLLKQAGYVTAGFGKWHLGASYTTLDGKPPQSQGKFSEPHTGVNIDLQKPIAGGPLDRGFDQWKGFVCASELLIFDGNRAFAQLGHDVYPLMEMPGADKLEVIKLADYLPRVTQWSTDFLRDRGAHPDGKPFFLYFAPYVPHIPLAVAKEFLDKTKAGEYGDYVHELDHYIGVLLTTLKEAGLDRNTLILFASDNGSQWTQTGENHHPNGSLRGVKMQIYEGGIRTPFIASWPDHIPAGSTHDDLFASTDVLATVADIIGETLPKTETAGPDSFDMLPLLLGKNPEQPIRKEVLTTSGVRQYALREGPWKFVKIASKRKQADNELYNLSDDPAEKNNLAGKEPERTARMAARFDELFHAKRTAP